MLESNKEITKDIYLKDATQVAYLSFIEPTVKILEGLGKKPPFTLRELISEHIDFELAKREVKREDPYNFKGIDNLSLVQLLQYPKYLSDNGISEFDKLILSKLGDEALDWKILYTHNTIDENGFYGCVIETSPENACVAFRGSEGMHTWSGLVNDWIRNDFGAINKKCTSQQAEVDKFMNVLISKRILDDYEKVDVTGHSLGGSLASHFGIVSVANEERKNKIFNKIGRIVNFDGQGFSRAYLDNFGEYVNQASSKIEHYMWSPVGDLLNPVPGEKRKYIKTKDGLNVNNFQIHHTDSIDFDENGFVQEGKQSTFAEKIGNLSRKVDKIPKLLTDEIYLMGSTIFETFFERGEDDKIVLKNKVLLGVCTYFKEGLEQLNEFFNGCKEIMKGYNHNFNLEPEYAR